jgi:hypothetical protein
MGGFGWLLRRGYWKELPVFLTVSVTSFWLGYIWMAYIAPLVALMVASILVLNRRLRRLREEEAAKRSV